ncbi:malto-oligosyltrehalose synthase [Ramlibacter sp.]|uniref:malto-oligosyltrehalose synthase n=1 Tax=Ramlibacter sp. TaxID=1917967 RepID=UPI002D189C62|nr:malto-oligosyltrehalose synthase [Ramlibacter sp.]HWI80404.1 malto-oligosyltrehalose synthase [Ramlibacter sp.]
MSAAEGTDCVAPEIAQLAEQSGVALRYESFWHEDVVVPEPVLRRALAAMGIVGAPPSRPDGLPPVQPAVPGQQLRWPAREGRTVAWTLARDEAPEQVAHRGIALREGDEHVLVLPPALETGYWRLVADDDQPGYSLLVVAPERCWVPSGLQQGERWWGCTVQLYALRSGRNWGIGDCGDLRRLIEAAARHGASFIGLSPLHALFPHAPAAASPYSPSSRTALNPIYLDVQSLVDLSGCAAAVELVHSEGFQTRLRALRETELVDYAGVAAAKQEVLRLLWRHFEQRDLAGNTSRGQHFANYVAQRRDTLARHALFEALQEHLFAADPQVWGWPAWPREYRDPGSPAVQAFEREHAGAVQYRFWLQWLSELQLESAQRYARTLGMGLGLYCDLAVGANEGGAETWEQPELYALGMHAGAPPDPLNTLGQDWGLPPVNPVALEAARCRPFIDILRVNMRHAGALRLDHVMGLMRLFWTGPDGGTYVRYPLATLLAILALESHRHQCLVIGEDLGNVAPRMREAMHERALVSYRPLLFERTADGGFLPPAQWQRQAMAVVSTHDLPTLRGFWLGEDIELAARLRLYPSEAAREALVLGRAQDRARLLFALQHESLLPPGASVQATSVPDATPAFVDAVYAYLARTPCWLLGVQLEDVSGQLLQVNVPGTTEDVYPNWRRKLSVSVEELASEPRFTSLAAVLRAERSGPAPLEETAAPLPPLDSADIPGATYRIQFHQGCTFEQVTRAVPYLQALGISHLYSSPYLRARPGSTHGYDIVDHTALNPEIGDSAAHERLCDALRRAGMRQMLDVVPNHMGVLEADNAWWLDLLEHGPASEHADTFDIEWQPAALDTTGRVLLPVLGDHYGRVLEAGEIQLQFDPAAGEFCLRYYAHRFPLDPAHYRDVFDVLPPPAPRDEQEADSRAVVESLLDSFARLPPRDTPSAPERRARVRDAAIHKKSLARLAQQHHWLPGWIRDCLAHLNGQAGEAASFDPLDRLIARQAYRLADWRAASDDVNYRRFFDVNTLAALRMERPEVFEATHRLLLRWLQAGQLAALRIDHPDGLSDPQQYFQRLQTQYARGAAVAGHEPRALYLVVEKILAEHEQLPGAWPVHGDTGYRFAGLVNGLLVPAAQEEAVDRLERAFTGRRQDFDEIAYDCRKLIIGSSLTSELGWLTQALHRISQANRRTRDFTRTRLRLALTEVAAAFPVYRTYLRDGEPPAASDRQHTDWAVAAAKRRLGGAEAGVLDHLRDVLFGEGEAARADPQQRARFIARWQQFTAPVMAKSIEDTAFYRYLRLASLNDVGSDPRRFGISVAAFHAANQARSRFKPHSLLATSTHDSKRGEDLRARIDVLAEDPPLWQESLARLAGLAERYVTETEGGPAPSRNDVWLLYQTLVGLWPATPPGDAERDQLRERVRAYMLKAAREAKLDTSWTAPVAAYEEALARYVDALLRPGQPNPFADELDRMVARLAPFGFRNSLAQVALKLTAPGVPDIYQGCEQWNFSLVDPDNRRAVDFGRLAADLAGLQALYAGRWPHAADWQRLQRAIGDGRLKQLVTWRLLQLRRAWPALFRDGAYTSLVVEGAAADHAVAYARQQQDQVVLVVAARLTYTLCGGEDGRWGPAAWGDTAIRFDEQQSALGRTVWRDWLTGREIERGTRSANALALAKVFADADALPFAVLVPAQGGPAA